MKDARNPQPPRWMQIPTNLLDFSGACEFEDVTANMLPGTI
jgi:hypothetical protein